MFALITLFVQILIFQVLWNVAQFTLWAIWQASTFILSAAWIVFKAAFRVAFSIILMSVILNLLGY